MMDTKQNIKRYLIDRCFDLNLIADRLEITPTNFENALAGDEKLDTDQLIVISQIARDSIDNIIHYKPE